MSLNLLLLGTSVFDAKDLSPPSPKLPQGKDHNDKDPDLDDEGYYNFTVCAVAVCNVFTY